MTQPTQFLLTDFFSGCGGTTQGLKTAGFEPTLSIDHDHDATQTYQLNHPNTHTLQTDIQNLPTNTIKPWTQTTKNQTRLFVGCAPCQPFAAHQKTKHQNDKRTHLLLEFLRFVETYQPELILVENVAGLTRIPHKNSPFTHFVNTITKQHNYHTTHKIIKSSDYGVPQTRRRLILLASKLGPITLPHPTHGPDTPNPTPTIQPFIQHLPPLKAGQTHPTDPTHRAAHLSPLNLQRIKHTPPGGDRRHWPPHLLPNCHNGTFKGHTDTYGRLHWNKPAPALTTRCVSYSNGRYGHPTQNRGITAREAACIQTFPPNYQFAGGLTSQAKQIGNAVPPLLAEKIGHHLIQHTHQHLTT